MIGERPSHTRSDPSMLEETSSVPVHATAVTCAGSDRTRSTLQSLVETTYAFWSESAIARRLLSALKARPFT